MCLKCAWSVSLDAQSTRRDNSCDRCVPFLLISLNGLKALRVSSQLFSVLSNNPRLYSVRLLCCIRRFAAQFSESLGANYSGQWQSSSILRITSIDATGAAPPSIAVSVVSVKASGLLRNTPPQSAATATTSPPISVSAWRSTESCVCAKKMRCTESCACVKDRRCTESCVYAKDRRCTESFACSKRKEIYSIVCFFRNRFW